MSAGPEPPLSCDLRLNHAADFKANGITGPKAKNREKARTASTRTVESRVVAIKAFSRWARRDGRTADYDLKALAKPRDPSDRRRSDECSRIPSCKSSSSKPARPRPGGESRRGTARCSTSWPP